MWDNTIGEKSAGLHVIGISDVPIYLYRTGREWVLFEGGLTVMGPLVLEQLRAITGDLATIRYWFITHAHYDHYGLLPYLTRYLDNVEIFASKEAVRGLNSKKAREVSASLNAALIDEWQFEMDRAQLVELFHPHAEGGHTLTSIGHGQRIELGTSISITAIATPGHSRCLMSYLIEPDGILLCSDALGAIINEHDFLPLIFDSYTDYHTSLKTLSVLSPAVVGLGHHGILTGDHARYAASIARDCLDKFESKLQEEASASSSNHLADSLTQKYWNKSRRFITRDLYNKSMLRMFNLIIDGKEKNYEYQKD